MAWSLLRIHNEKSRPTVNARKYTHAMAIATRTSSRQPSWGSEFSIDSWQLEEIPSGERKKQNESGNTASTEPEFNERRKDKEEGKMPRASLFRAEGEDGLDRRGYARGQITREEGYGKKKKACRHDEKNHRSRDRLLLPGL